MRLQQYIAAAGCCSRREAERWIAQGRVTLNGRKAQLGMRVEAPTDQVCVDGQPVRLLEEYTYIMLHKPRGYVTTLRDEKGRPTVADLVKDAGCRLFPVGRLDWDSEGLLILTNDGPTANRLAHPSHGVEKTYHVWVTGGDLETAADRLRRPVTWKGVLYSPARVEILSRGKGGGKLAVSIGQGKNRQVRNMCAAAGLQVQRLLRVRQGQLRLGRLPAGKWRYLTPEEVNYLHKIG